MGTDAANHAELGTIIEAALRGDLTQERAERANDLGREATNAVMLAVSARIAELNGRLAPGPHTPSGSIPPPARPRARTGIRINCSRSWTGPRRIGTTPSASA